MAGRLTPHVLVAGSAVLVTLVCTLSILIFGGGSWPVPTKDLLIVGPAAEPMVLDAGTATDPLIPDFAHPPDVDPFNPRAVSAPSGLPPPPPPQLAPPSLPVLPAPVQ